MCCWVYSLLHRIRFFKCKYSKRVYGHNGGHTNALFAFFSKSKQVTFSIFYIIFPSLLVSTVVVDVDCFFLPFFYFTVCYSIKRLWAFSKFTKRFVQRFLFYVHGTPSFPFVSVFRWCPNSSYTKMYIKHIKSTSSLPFAAINFCL